MTVVSPSTALVPIEYPESDGKPVAETGIHVQELLFTLSSLLMHYRNTPDVYAGGNMLLYYEQGNPKAVTSPDVFVVKGTHKTLRRTYKLWEEDHAPHVIFEITSRSTRREDRVEKRRRYAAMGVAEYFLFDPLEEYLTPSLQGLRLINGGYQPIMPDKAGRLECRELGLYVLREGSILRLMDMATGSMLQRPPDQTLALENLQAELNANRVLMSEMQRQQGEEATAYRQLVAQLQARAEAAEKLVAQLQARAEAAEARAEAAEAQISQLWAAIEQLRQGQQDTQTE